MRLDFVDARLDPEGRARSLGISRHALDLYLDSDVIDLHVDSFIWTRIFGYDLRARHGRGLLGAHFYSQVDFPRVLEAGVTGATWIVTTNPFKVASERASAFEQNLADLKAIFASVPEHFELVRTAAEYRSARQRGKHGAFLGVQGGNALEARPEVLDRLDGAVLRVTVVHLTSSAFGSTSSPAARSDEGLTRAGRAFVERLNANKIFVDLAHISKRGFWDAVEVADASQPLLVTHTGVSGVHEHWRNLDDDQLRAIARSGGTVGIMYEPTFLGSPKFAGEMSRIVDHLEHVVRVVGEDHASLGSDWDGAISTPRDMPTCLELPRLVQAMLDRGFSEACVRKILGGNFLRVVQALRG
jgi:membrane dipeptidase